MKNNKIHRILGVITEPGTESKPEWRYDELPGKLEMEEMEIRGHCDTIEKDDPGLIQQRQADGWFTRSYDRCRKAYKAERYKEPEPATVPKPNLLQRIGKFTSDFSGVLASLATVGSFLLGYVALQQSKTVDTLSKQLKDISEEVSKQRKEIDSLKVHKPDALVRPSKP